MRTVIPWATHKPPIPELATCEFAKHRKLPALLPESSSTRAPASIGTPPHHPPHKKLTRFPPKVAHSPHSGHKIAPPAPRIVRTPSDGKSISAHRITSAFSRSATKSLRGMRSAGLRREEVEGRICWLWRCRYKGDKLRIAERERDAGVKEYTSYFVRSTAS